MCALYLWYININAIFMFKSVIWTSAKLTSADNSLGLNFGYPELACLMCKLLDIWLWIAHILSFYFCLWCKPTVKVKNEQEKGDIYIFQRKDLLDNCNSNPGMLGDWHRLTRQVVMALLLPSAASCLQQLLPSSVPTVLIDSIQIPRTGVHEMAILMIFSKLCSTVLMFFIPSFQIFSQNQNLLMWKRQKGQLGR